MATGFRVLSLKRGFCRSVPLSSPLAFEEVVIPTFALIHLESFLELGLFIMTPVFLEKSHNVHPARSFHVPVSGKSVPCIVKSDNADCFCPFSLISCSCMCPSLWQLSCSTCSLSTVSTFIADYCGTSVTLLVSELSLKWRQLLMLPCP